MRSNKTVPYVAGAVLFAGVVGVWLWRLPGVLGRVGNGAKDQGLQDILSVFKNESPNTGDFAKIQSGLNSHLADINTALNQAAVTGAAIDKLKNKIEIEAKLKAGMKNAPPAAAPASVGLPVSNVNVKKKK